MSNQWNSTVVENTDKLQNILKGNFKFFQQIYIPHLYINIYLIEELLDNRQSCGEVIRYRLSPHVKKILSDVAKKEEETKPVQADKDKKEKITKKDTEAAKSPMKSAKMDESIVSAENIEASESSHHDELKRIEFIKNLERLRKENSNMILYGLPDIYLAN